MEWPNLIKASGLYIYHTLGETRVIIQIEKSKVKYKEKENISKYVVHRDPNTSTCINVEIMNIMLHDAGFYTVGTTDDESSLDRGFFLVVTGKYSNVSSMKFEMQYSYCSCCFKYECSRGILFSKTRGMHKLVPFLIVL